MLNVCEPYIDAANGNSFDGRYILKILFAEPTGAMFFSNTRQPLPSVSAVCRILDSSISRSDGLTRADIALSDETGFLRDRFDSGDLEARPAILYHSADDLSPDDCLPLASGSVAPDIDFSIETKTVRLRVISGASALRSQIGTLATRERFPTLLPNDEGRMLPIIYGRVKRVRAVGAELGARTVLSRPLRANGNELWVADPRGFPSGSIQLKVGDEVIAGSFLGKKFNISNRELTVQSGYTTHFTDSFWSIRDTASLCAEDDAYNGFNLRLSVFGVQKTRRIFKSVGGDAKLLRYSPPFLKSDGSSYKIPPGTSYQIRTAAQFQPLGTMVSWTPSSGATYVVSDAPVSAIRDVFIETKNGELTALDRMFWTANLDDDRFAETLGGSVATVTLARRPMLLSGVDADSDTLYADIEGPTNSESSLIESPSEIIRRILIDRIGLDGSNDIDSVSFDSAAESIGNLVFGFALNEPADGWTLCRSLAMQARAILDFSGRTAALIALPASLSESVCGMIDRDSALVDTLLPLRRNAHYEPISAIICRYGSGENSGEFIVCDETAAARFGDKVKRLDLFAHLSELNARAVAEFWLSRLSAENSTLEIIVKQPFNRFTPGDALALDCDETLPAGLRGEVLEINHLTRDSNAPERCRMTLRIPIRDGCESACEIACESGCESGCEAFCETACEAGCETDCETACQTADEMSCMTACELSCTAACQTQCQSGCEIGLQTGCGSSCQASYEADCESSCVSSCETECIVFCESGCETEGEAGCETELETTCETVCEADCEADVEIESETVDAALSLAAGSESPISDGRLSTTIGDLFVIREINGTPVLCLKDGLFISDGSQTGLLALKYDSATGKWGIDLAFFS